MNSSIIDTLEWSGIILNRWIALIIFIFGVLGNFFNLMVFSRGTFFKQSCSLYLVAISINNLAIFFIGLLTRVLREGFQVIMFGGSSNTYCKIPTYIVYTLFAISNWFFVFATIDRLYSTNRSALKRKQFCLTSMALKFIFLTIIVCLLIHTHVLIYYEYFYKLNSYDQLSLTCTTNNIAYNIFFSFFMLIFYSLLPPILMSIIGLLTLNNIRKSRRHINPFILQRITRRNTIQLCKSLSIQIIILVILTIPHSCYWIYAGLTTNQYLIKANLTRAYEKLLLSIVRILLYISYGSSFYIQIVISRTFQNEFLKIIDNIKRYFRNFF